MTSHPITRARLGTVAVCAVLLILEAGLALASGRMSSPSFVIPTSTIDSGSEPGLASSNFRGSGCLGELGDMVHTSASFRMLAGYCAQEHWLSRSYLVDAPTAAAVVATALGSPVPNPARGISRLECAIRQGEVGSLRLYDVSGRVVRTLFSGLRGPVRQTWEIGADDGGGQRLEPGLYFVRLETNARKLTHKVILLAR